MSIKSSQDSYIIHGIIFAKSLVQRTWVYLFICFVSVSVFVFVFDIVGSTQGLLVTFLSEISR